MPKTMIEWQYFPMGPTAPMKQTSEVLGKLEGNYYPATFQGWTPANGGQVINTTTHVHVDKVLRIWTELD